MQPINIYNSPDVKVTIDENGTPVDVYVSGGSSLSIAFYSTYSALPSPGQEGILYITEDTNYLYRWDGALNAYIQVGGGAASLQDVTDVGNTTTNDIQLINDADVILGAGGKVLMDNGSKLQEGTTDAGNGGSKGIALKCSVDYELKWEAGRLYTMEQDGFTIREVSHNFTFAPSVTDDDSKGFIVGSRWILDNGDIYTCTDATTGTAVWSLEPAKVPYTGATGNVNLGEYGVTGGYYQFDTTPTEYNQAVGNVGWNDTEGTIETLLKGGSVVLEIGQKLVARVVNGTGGNVLRSNYQVVKVTGAQGQRLQVNLAQGNNDANSADTLGLIAENISNNQSGFIVTSGIISEINTTGSLQSETWADGDPLYLSPTTAGKVTNVKPQAPNHTVIVGFVVYAHSVHGKIFVKIDNGYELDELHNVKINTPLNGQVLRYNGTTFVWENSNDSDNLTFNAPLSRSVNAISISQSSASANGYLSSTDWSTFNGKQNALTNPVTGTGTNNEIAYFNTTGSTIGSLSTATYPSLTELSYVKGVTSAIQTQLNAKQGTLTLTTTGTSGAATLVGSTLNIPQYAAGITGSGTSGQVAYWNGTSSQTGSATFTFSPTAQLLVNNSITASSAIARGVNLTPTLTAAANNDVLVGLDINPTFTNGAFTGVSNIGIRILGALLGQNQRSFIITPADSLGFINMTADISTTINYTCGYNGHNFKYNDGTNSSTPLVIRHNQISGIPTQDNQVTLGLSNTRWSNVWSVKTFADSYGFGNTSNIGLAYNANPTNGIRFDFTNNLLTFYNNSTSSARFFSNGNLLIQTGGTITDSGYKLDVNGTARVQGNLTTNLTAGSIPFIGTGGLLSQNNSSLFWDNTNGRLGIGTSSPSSTFEVIAGSDANGIKLRGRSSDNISNIFFSSNSGTQYGYFQHRSTVFRVVNNVGDIEFWNGPNTGSTSQKATLFTSGNFAIGNTSDAGYILDASGTVRIGGNLTISDTINIILGSTTGTKIGTATSQKIGFWNATPIVQPTTAVAASTLVNNLGTPLTDTDTFDGYTLKQIVKALRNTGILA